MFAALVQKKSRCRQYRWLVCFLKVSFSAIIQKYLLSLSILMVSFFKCLRADRMAQLLDERDLGVLTSSTSLLVALVSNNHEAYWSCLPKCVKILERLARNQDIPQEYTYYGIPSPWLQVSIYMFFFVVVFWKKRREGGRGIHSKVDYI